MFIVIFLIALFVGVAVTFGIEVSNPDINENWSTIRVAGYSKAAITLIKYMPQVYLNWKRKSTVGWSLENVLLDFGGGFFSFMQMFMTSIPYGKSIIDSSDGFNIVKFLLSVLSIIFDLIFMFQHYVLYRDKWANKKKEKDPDERLGILDQHV